MAATHRGECQLCGATYKVNKAGLIANHDYKAVHVLIQGICLGSSQLPFEISRSYLDELVASLHTKLSATHAAILAELAVPSAWVKTQGRVHDIWHKAELTQDGNVFRYMTNSGLSGVIQTEGQSLETTVWILSRERIDELETEERIMECWIANAERRLKEWQMRDLSPI